MTFESDVMKGCAIVEFSTAQEAAKAIRELNESVLDRRPLFLREDREQEIRGDREYKRGPPGGVDHRQLFVGNVIFVKSSRKTLFL